MLGFVEIIVALLLVLAFAVLIKASTKPDNFAVRRSVNIAAPPEKIFPLINDLRAQSSWSPFEKDPGMKRTHSGAPQGPGAVYEWDGNKKVGAGRIAITESVPSSRVSLLLEMVRPFKARNDVEFTLEPQGGATRVTWAMRGAQPFMAKVVSTVVDCDKMVGSQFDEGLAKLKTIVES